MSEGLVLTLDGSTGMCGAAILQLCPALESNRAGGDIWEVLARRTEADGRGQARSLLRLVDEMLRWLGASPDDLSAVVVGTGPGTFTGVRIAVATARALGLALARPVIGVSSLGALAAGAAAAVIEDPRFAAGLPDMIVPIVDARRGQVFYGVYARSAGGGAGESEDRAGVRWVRSAPFAVCDREILGSLVTGAPSQANRQVVITGEKSELVGDLPAGLVFSVALLESERLVLGQQRLEEPGEYPEGWRLGPWLVRALDQTNRERSGLTGPKGAGVGDVGTPETVKPIYVRCPDADVHITKMKDPWAVTGGRGGGHDNGRPR